MKADKSGESENDREWLGRSLCEASAAASELPPWARKYPPAEATHERRVLARGWIFYFGGESNPSPALFATEEECRECYGNDYDLACTVGRLVHVELGEATAPPSEESEGSETK